MDSILKQTSEHSYSFDFSGTKKAGIDASSVGTVNGNNKFVVATDCDDVLVDISNKWMSKIMNDHILRDYITTAHHEVIALNATLRSTYYINDWLGIADPGHVKRMLDLYFNDPTFYDDLAPLPYARALLGMAGMLETIHVVTSCGETVDDPVNNSKKRFLARLFSEFPPEVEVKFHLLPSSIKKGQYMKDKGITFNTFVDDHVKNIINVIECIEGTKPEILMPVYGWNGNVQKDVAEVSVDKEYFLTPFHNVNTHSADEYRSHVMALNNIS